MKKIALFISSMCYGLTFAGNENNNSNLLDGYFDEGVFSSISPQAPTAASLGQYGTHPVDLSTGLVPITIPLYVVKSGSLEVPIQLSYHGGGIKVEQDASWVGLGWSLDFGGSITRTKNGYPDEEENYSNMPDASAIIKKLDENNTETMRYCHLWSGGNLAAYTFQPDLFSYSFGGHSGTFYLSEDKESIITNSYDPIVGSLAALSGKSHKLSLSKSFVLPDGTKYYFNESESTRVSNASGTIAQYTSAYYVQAIISANGADTIRYEYQKSGDYSQQFRSQYDGVWSSNGILNGSSMEGYNSTIHPQLIGLKRTALGHYTSTVKPLYIYYRGGRISFDLTSGLFTTNNEKCKKLSSITVEVLNEGKYEPIKSFRFYYSTGTSKLLLQSVDEKNLKTGEVKSLSSFEYYGGVNYNGQDYWGYYNGKNNANVVPRTWVQGTLVGNADRTPNEEAMKNYSLKKIIYPTGGSTEFIWEINRVLGDKSSYPVVPVNKSLTISATPDSTVSCSSQSSNKGDALPRFDLDFTPPSTNSWKEVTIYNKYPQTVTLTYTMSAKDSTGFTHGKYDDIHIMINDIVKKLPKYTSSISEQISYDLKENEKYTFSISANCHNLSGFLTIDYIDTSDDSNAGSNTEGWKFTGLRIKEMIQCDVDGSIIKRTQYGYKNPSGYCSGYLTSIDNQVSNIKNNYDLQIVNGTDNMVRVSIYMKHNTIVSSDIETGPRDNQFAYEYATETIIDGKTNKMLACKKYHFNKVKDLQDNTHTPVVSMSHMRAQQLELDEYDMRNDGCKLIRSTQCIYSKDSRIKQSRKGFLVYTPYMGNAIVSGERCKNCIDAMGGGTGTSIYSPMNYQLSTIWSHLDSQKVTEYLDDGSVSETCTSYIYGIHTEPIEINMKRGTEEFVTRIIYSGNLADEISKTMVKNNMCGVPVYQRLYQKVSGKEILQGGTYNVYNDKFLKTEVFKLYNENDEEKSKRLYHYEYNDNLMLSEYCGPDNIPTSIWWDKYSIRPLVVVTGMSASELKKALSGKVLTEEDLISLYTDDKFKNKNVMLQTYTYHIDGNVKSVTQPNGVTTYYKYDGLGRLSSVLNQKKKTVQKMIYHYSKKEK